MKFEFGAQHISSEKLIDLLRRLELGPKIIRRSIEEEIVDLVPIEKEWLLEKRNVFFQNLDQESFLNSRGWDENDLDIHLKTPEAIRRFAEQMFGTVLEEHFLKTSSKRDMVVYSLCRVKDASLARELWIRLEENEVTFADAATEFSEGFESAHKGVIGPLPLSQIQPPFLAQIISGLQPGEINPPFLLGEWHVLVRLEKLMPARFDSDMRAVLLQELMNEFLQYRVKQILAGDEVDDLNYYQQ